MVKDSSTSTKGLDGFQVKTLEFMSRIAQNPKPWLAVIGAILVAAAIGVGISSFSKNKQEDRRLELSKIDLVFDQEIKAYSKEREAIEKKRDTLKAATPVPAAAAPDKLATPAPESPEILVLNEQIQKLKPQHKASSEQYRDFFHKYPKSPEGLLAGLRYASYSAEQKQTDEAQKILEEVVSKSQEYSVLQTQSLMLLISVLEDKEQFDKALEYADRFLKSASADIKPRAMLSKAQIYFLKKDYGNSQTTLNQLLSEHASSTEADQARNLLALIPQQG